MMACQFALANDDPFAEGDLENERPSTEEGIEDWTPKNLAVLVEYIAVDHRDLTKLLRKCRHDVTDVRLRELVGEMMDGGSAEVVEITQLVTRNGQPTQSESIVEIIYATEHDPAELPQKLNGPIANTDRLVTPATPTAFSTRNVGLTVKVTTQLGPARQFIDLDFLSEVVKHEEDGVSGQRESKVSHPYFYTMRVITSIVVPVNTSTLVGVHTPSEEFQRMKREKVFSGKRLMVFVRAVAQPIAKPERMKAVWDKTLETDETP